MTAKKECLECILGFPLKKGRNYITRGNRIEVRDLDEPYILRSCLNLFDVKLFGKEALVKGQSAECVKLSSFKIKPRII